MRYRCGHSISPLLDIENPVKKALVAVGVLLLLMQAVPTGSVFNQRQQREEIVTAVGQVEEDIRLAAEVLDVVC